MLQGENYKIEKQFLSKVKTYIAQHNVVRATGHYLVALSGGADSVALLLTMQDMGFHIEAAHCNFHLRGEESDRDEQFCKNLCERRGVSLHLAHFDTRGYAALHHVSIEMAARSLRYAYFQNLCKDLSLDGICVAHHRDDSVETLLINLIRGTGINGLTGIAPRNGHVLRPLLDVSREDILEYLSLQQQDYVTDSTNLVPDVVRNKIRLQVLPLLRTINPSVSDSIATTATHLAEANKMLIATLSDSRLTQTDSKGITAISKEELLSKASPEFVLHALLSPYHFQGTSILEILNSIDAVGKRWQSSTHQVVIDRNHILVKALEKGKQSCALKIPETGKYSCAEGQHIKVESHAKTPDFCPSRKPMVATLDADKVEFPLTLRRTIPGDRFRPFGMKGSKLVSDFLTDIKCNAFEKEEQLVVEDASQRIVWLIGRRTADDFRIDDSTNQILQIEYIST